jgi:hypothetical protein
MDVIWSGMQDQYIKIGDAGSLAEMYPSCAQLNIVNDATMVLPKGVKIPEIFMPLEPGERKPHSLHSSERRQAEEHRAKLLRSICRRLEG